MPEHQEAPIYIYLYIYIEQQSVFSNAMLSWHVWVWVGSYLYDWALPSRSPSSTDTDDDLTKNLLEVTEPYKDRGGLRSQWPSKAMPMPMLAGHSWKRPSTHQLLLPWALIALSNVADWKAQSWRLQCAVPWIQTSKQSRWQLQDLAALLCSRTCSTKGCAVFSSVCWKGQQGGSQGQGRCQFRCWKSLGAL